MQQKPYRTTNMEFSGRATGYTRRPVADVQARYRTSKAATPTKVTSNDIKPFPKQSQKIENKIVAIKPTNLTKKTAAGHKPKIVNDVQNNRTNFTSSKQFIVPLTHNAPQKQHIQTMPKIPTLPTPKKGFKHAVAKKLRIKSKKQASGIALSTLAVLLLGLGIAVNVHSFSVSKKIEAQANSVDNSSGENGRPDSGSGYSESQPNSQAISSYTVAADLPRLLQIPSLGTLARVKRVGVTDNNQVGSPQNVFDVAWYDGSAKPGQPGAVFIDGHVLGPTKGGIFANLKNIKTGAKITIVMGDDKAYTYTVAATEKLDTDTVDMNKMLRSYDSTKQGLNLMTCNGTYLKDKKTFDKRFIVYAVREN
jgi:sortase (surface protein transpeptidase)